MSEFENLLNKLLEKTRYHVFRFLQKPFDSKELLTAVKEYLGQNGSSLAQGVSSKLNESSANVLIQPRESKSKKNLPKYFPGILLYYHHEKTTGILKLKKNKLTKVIYLERGQPVGVETRVKKEHLGPFLVEKGVITEEDYLKAARMMVEEGIQLGEAMVRLGALEANLLEDLVGEHQTAKIANCFLWLDAEVQFEKQDVLPKIHNKKEIPIHEVYSQGLKQLKKISKLSQILKPLGQEYMGLNELFKHYKHFLQFSENDLQFVNQFNSGYQLEEILDEKSEPILVPLYLFGMLESSQPNVKILLNRLQELKNKNQQKNNPDWKEELEVAKEQVHSLLSEKKNLEEKYVSYQEKVQTLTKSQDQLSKIEKELKEAHTKLDEMKEKNLNLEEQRKREEEEKKKLQSEIENFKLKTNEVQNIESKLEPTQEELAKTPIDSAPNDTFDSTPMDFSVAQTPSQASKNPLSASEKSEVLSPENLFQDLETPGGPLPNPDMTQVFDPLPPPAKTPGMEEKIFELANEFEALANPPASNPDATLAMEHPEPMADPFAQAQIPPPKPLPNPLP